MQMQCWEKGPAAAQMQRELQCEFNVGRKDQQQHGCRGSCRTDAAVVVAESWAAVQDAVVQRMLRREA